MHVCAGGGYPQRLPHAPAGRQQDRPQRRPAPAQVLFIILVIRQIFVYNYIFNLLTTQCLMVLNFRLKAYCIIQGQRCDQTGEDNLVL